MSNQTTTLSSLSVNGKGTYGIAASAVPFSKDKYTYLRITDINDDGTLNLDDLKSVDDPDASKYLLQPNDIVFARTGASTGRNYFYDGSDGTFVYAGFLIKFSIDPKKVNPLYVKYFCQSQKYKDWIHSFNTGSTRGNINERTLAQMPIKLPNRKQQDVLVEVLSKLDDKIKLNNQINRNLEEQAQTLFKNWFVDFAPFGGQMPEDWTTASLSDIADYLNGLAMQKFRPKENEMGLPVLKIKELRQGFPGEDAEQCSPSIKPEYIVNDGDVIFSWSGSLLVDLWCGGKCGLNQHLFKVTSQKFDKWFYYLWTKHHLDRFVFLAADKATTMGHIKREELDKAEVCIPSKTDYNKIGSSLEPMIETIITKRVENQRLTTLRDELLPKLMSGEIDTDKIAV